MLVFNTSRQRIYWYSLDDLTIAPEFPANHMGLAPNNGLPFNSGVLQQMEVTNASVQYYSNHQWLPFTFRSNAFTQLCLKSTLTVFQLQFASTAQKTISHLHTRKNCAKWQRTESGLVAFLRHLARKWSGSILTTPEPARGSLMASGRAAVRPKLLPCTTEVQPYIWTHMMLGTPFSLSSPIETARRRRRFWHAIQDCAAPYVDHILHWDRFWAVSITVWIMYTWSQILLHSAQPCDAGASSRSPPVLWRESRQDPLGTCVVVHTRKYGQPSQGGHGVYSTKRPAVYPASVRWATRGIFNLGYQTSPTFFNYEYTVLETARQEINYSVHL